MHAKSLPLSSRAAIAREQAKRRGISQAELAQRLGLTQPQVSRLLSGKVKRESRSFADLCKLLSGTDLQHTSADAVPEEIRAAVLEVWDGTPTHAVAIATVIRALVLIRSAPSFP